MATIPHRKTSVKRAVGPVEKIPWLKTAGCYVYTRQNSGGYMVVKKYLPSGQLLQECKQDVYYVGASLTYCTCPGRNHPTCKHREQARVLSTLLFCPNCGFSDSPHIDFIVCLDASAEFTYPVSSGFYVQCNKCSSSTLRSPGWRTDKYLGECDLTLVVGVLGSYARVYSERDPFAEGE